MLTCFASFPTVFEKKRDFGKALSKPWTCLYGDFYHTLSYRILRRNTWLQAIALFSRAVGAWVAKGCGHVWSPVWVTRVIKKNFLLSLEFFFLVSISFVSRRHIMHFSISICFPRTMCISIYDWWYMGWNLDIFYCLWFMYQSIPKPPIPPPGQSPGIWLALSSLQRGIWPKMRLGRWGIWLSCQNVCQRWEAKGFRNPLIQHASGVHGSLLLSITHGFFCCCRFIYRGICLCLKCGAKTSWTRNS